EPGPAPEPESEPEPKTAGVTAEQASGHEPEGTEQKREEKASSATTQTAPEPPSGSSTSSETSQAAAYVTPLVRKLAKDNDIDLAQIEGTGIGARSRKQDVLAAAKAKNQPQESAPTAAAPAASAPAASSAPAAASVPAGLESNVPQSKRGTREKMSRLRKVIAERMVDSLKVSAQLTTVVEVDMTKVARVRDAANADFQRREGTKLSFLPCIALATAEALKAHPGVNSSVEGDEIVYHGQENLSIAVDTEGGLITPVVK